MPRCRKNVICVRWNKFSIWVIITREAHLNAIRLNKDFSHIHLSVVISCWLSKWVRFKLWCCHRFEILGNFLRCVCRTAHWIHSFWHRHSIFLLFNKFCKSTKFLILSCVRKVLRHFQIYIFFIKRYSLFGVGWNDLSFRINICNFSLSDDISFICVFVWWVARPFFTSFELILDVQRIETITMVSTHYQM